MDVFLIVCYLLFQFVVYLRNERSLVVLTNYNSLGSINLIVLCIHLNIVNSVSFVAVEL